MIYNEGDEVKEDEMDETYRMHGRDEKCIQHFSRKPWKEGRTLGDLGFCRKIILK